MKNEVLLDKILLSEQTKEKIKEILKSCKSFTLYASTGESFIIRKRGKDDFLIEVIE